MATRYAARPHGGKAVNTKFGGRSTGVLRCFVTGQLLVNGGFRVGSLVVLDHPWVVYIATH